VSDKLAEDDRVVSVFGDVLKCVGVPLVGSAVWKGYAVEGEWIDLLAHLLKAVKLLDHLVAIGRKNVKHRERAGEYGQDHHRPNRSGYVVEHDVLQFLVGRPVEAEHVQAHPEVDHSSFGRFWKSVPLNEALPVHRKLFDHRVDDLMLHAEEMIRDAIGNGGSSVGGSQLLESLIGLLVARRDPLCRPRTEASAGQRRWKGGQKA